MKSKKLTNQDLWAMPLKAARQCTTVVRSSLQARHFRHKILSDERDDLREIIRVWEAGLTDSCRERLEEIRLERTGISYPEDGMANHDWAGQETVGDLIDAITFSEFTGGIYAE